MNNHRPTTRRLSLAASLLILPCPSHAELVGYWKLDGNFDDSSGNGNDGQLFGTATYDTDVPAELGGGQSVAFDGLPGTYGAINPGTGLAITTEPTYTISMWVKGDGTANSDDRVFSEGMSTDNNPLFNVGTHNQSANGTVDFYIRNGGGATTYGHVYSAGTAFDNTWHHLTVISTNKVIDLYIDGVLDGQYDYNIVPDFVPDTTTIGGILRGTDCCNFLGNIDEVAIWDNALTAAEASLLADGTDPTDLGLDNDNDGLPDAWETENDLATDDDGSVDPNNGPDGDPDDDGATNLEEFENKTDPQDADTDDDTLSDGDEIAIGTNPNSADTDSDGLEDGEEGDLGTNPLSGDTDGDGISDGDEVDAGSDPTNSNSPSIADRLSAYWPLDTTDGTTTPDLGPNGYHLNLMNMDATNFVTDEGRAVASFDGVDELLVRTHGPDDDLPISQHPAYTISMWVKVMGASQNDNRFFSESSTSGNNDPLLNLGTQNQGADNRFDLYLRDQGSPNHQYSLSEPLDGTWRHIAYTHNDSNQTIQLYIDGVLDRDDWTFKDITSPDVDTTTLGGILRGSSCCLVQGLVDDVSLWKGVMPPETIAELAAGASPGDIIGLGAFQITSVTRNNDGSVELTWNSRPDTLYTLEASLGLESGWLEVDDGINSQGETTTYTFPAGVPGLDSSVEPVMFFRVKR